MISVPRISSHSFLKFQRNKWNFGIFIYCPVLIEKRNISFQIPQQTSLFQTKVSKVSLLNGSSNCINSSILTRNFSSRKTGKTKKTKTEENQDTLLEETAKEETSNLSEKNAEKPIEKKKNYDSMLSATIKDLEKKFGKGSVMILGDTIHIFKDLKVLSTGSIGLDCALGIGGFPRGRIVEIYGPESSGKTTLALKVISEAQKSGGRCAFIDAEHALDSRWAQILGVQNQSLLIAQPDSGEQALDIAETLITSGNIDVVVIDSVAALVPKAELEGEMGEFVLGGQARLMSSALRKLTAALAKQPNTCLIFINQIRHKIGVMFGSPETTSGGNALKYYASIRIDVRRSGSVTHGEHVVGSTVKAKVVKNKLAAPFKLATFEIDFGKGLSKEGELVDLGIKCGVLEKAGSWYSFEGTQLGQGREKVKAYFEQNPEACAKVEKLVREKLTDETILKEVEAEEEGENKPQDGE